MKQDKIFWNLKSKARIDDITFIEHTLKYGDFEDIVELFNRFDKKKIKDIWLKNMAGDSRFLKLNVMIARVFFDMDVESDYFKRLNDARFEIRVSIK
ncbi:hypothetical protein SAMN04488516_102357 [Desulfonauticus submarinus]|uniref:Uncharacterized protein n=1 Tax=Desulfonauticus submarinus TaxID=206665 RepID=A0A1H0C044_9BACT|nr:hypothetical protein [Desulfonauticus submarinus]SDN51318.1 hypothetical protein SAMN04488516_102357 [Desulfonauticus submarinus]